MTRQEVQEKLNKAIEAVEKKRGTLARHEKRLEKLNGIIAASGYTMEEIKTWTWSNDKTKNDLIWNCSDIEHCLEDIQRTKETITEKEKIVEKWTAKLAEETKREKLFATEFPEVLKSFQNETIEAWDLWDYMERERLSKEKIKLGYRKFMEKHSYSEYMMISKTDEEIHKENVRSSNALCLNLWNRVKDIVGEATDWSGLCVRSGNQYEGCVINGLVIGTNGVAEVKSISAGGWNIQRWHIRTLVHKIK